MAVCSSVPGFAQCKTGAFLNPLTDVAWENMFPAKIGGVTIMSNNSIEEPPDVLSSPICVCGATIGTTVSFNEPSNIAETVKDSMCFTVAGVSVPLGSDADYRNGSLDSAPDQRTEMIYQNGHWYTFPVFALMNLFTDFPCLQRGGLDMLWIGEVDPTWSNDLLSFFENPESLIFGNIVTQMSCAADSVAANIGYPLDPLFWCMGSWGSAYPVGGNIATSLTVQGNAALAARMIFKQGRMGLLWDTATSQCGPSLSLIWQKSHFHLQIAKPVTGSQAIPIGRSSMLWGTLKNPPFGTSKSGDSDFLWIIFKKRVCCSGYAIGG